jgi:protoporphyrinogen oxidase
LEIEGDKHFDDQWLYIHSPDLDVGRITNFSNWVPEINKDSPNTIMVLEYWGNNDDVLWHKDDDSLIEKASAELKKTGLIKNASVLNGLVKKIPKSYPIYSKGYKENLNVVYAFLKEFKNLSVIGRYGAFKYNNQDHSILMGLLAAENIQNNNENNLWDVNSDYEFQESCRIVESGIVKT